MPASPQLTDEEGERPSGFPGARLKYTTTIMGRRSGGMGIRTTGKRASTSKRMSGTPRQTDVKNFVSENALAQGSLSTTAPVTTSLRERNGNNLVKVSTESEQATSSSHTNVQVIEPTASEEAPVAKVVQFIPKFKGAAEMEARRRARMAARRGPGAPAPAQPPPPLTLDSSSSSSDEADIVPSVDDSSDSDFGEVAGGSLDDGDEFDP